MIKTVKIFSLNVNGIRTDVLKRRKIFYFFHHSNADLVMLQEIHSDKEVEKFWRAEWGGKIYFSHGTSNSRGVAILIKKNFPYQITNAIGDNDGRIVAITVKAYQRDYTIASLYAPNQDNVQFFVQAFELIGQLQNDLQIIAGDFNTVLDLNKDIKGGKGHSNVKTREFLNEYMEQNDLIDIWRMQHQDDFKSTFIRNRPVKLLERIDFFLVSAAIQQNIIKTDILVKFLSDHSPVELHVDFVNFPPGRGYWKLNNALLEDEKIRNEIPQAILEVFRNLNGQDYFLQWESMKLAVREVFLKRSIQLAKSKNNKIEVIERKLKGLTEQRDAQSPEFLLDGCERQIELLTMELNDLFNERTAGAMMRCKTNWVEMAEKPSSYFLNLEKHNYNKKVITRIMDPTTQKCTSDPEDISQILTTYFKRLFSGEEGATLDPDYLGTIEFPQLKEGDKYMLDAPIQLEEINIALKQMNKSKTPGVDGLTPEFYLQFWPWLARPIHHLFTEITKRKNLHQSAKEGIFSLLGKPGKDPLRVPNWRPITLLNTDYKLYAKVLANRLLHVLPYIIHPDQSGYMKGRSISDNILDLLSIIEHCDKYQQPALLVSVDFQRAYDSVSIKALEQIMYAFNFGKDFIEMVLLCYKDTKATVMNNNIWHDWFELRVGLRQGCTLSCFVFLLVTSVIGMRIRQNDAIKGVKIGKRTKKLNQYVDDLWNIIQYELESFQELLFEYEEFADYTGLKINYDKTEILRRGSLHNSDAQFYSTLPLKWSDGPIRVLGINVHPKYQNLLKLNYEDILQKIENLLLVWQSRSLTPIGKIQVVNTLCNSQFVYRLQCLPSPPRDLMSKYNQIVRNFIWDGKKAKIAYKRLIASKEAGGLQLRDLHLIDASLKMAKFKTITEKSCFWTEHVFQEIPLSAKHLSCINISSKDLQKMLPPSFFRDVCSIWVEANYKKKITSLNEILQQIIWYNSNIKNNKKCIFNGKMYQAGVVKIVDLFNLDTGVFFTFEEFVALYGNVVDFVTYYQVVRAIPKDWKRILLQNEPSKEVEKTILSIKFFNPKTKLSRFCYQYLRDTSTVSNEALKTIWQNDLKIQITEQSFSSFFKTIPKITLCTKLRYFQYRILCKALTLNIHVAKWDLTVSSLCTFCQTKKETMIHFFCECEKVKGIWKALKKWLKYFHNMSVNFTNSNIIFCNYSKRNAKMINNLILITKFYVYKVKVQGSSLRFINLVKEISRYKSIDRVIASKKDSLYKYARKWDDFSVFNC